MAKVEMDCQKFKQLWGGAYFLMPMRSYLGYKVYRKLFIPKENSKTRTAAALQLSDGTIIIDILPTELVVEIRL